MKEISTLTSTSQESRVGWIYLLKIIYILDGFIDPLLDERKHSLLMN